MKSIRQSLRLAHQRKSTKMTITVNLYLLFLSLLSHPLPPSHILLYVLYILFQNIQRSSRCGMLTNVVAA